MADRNFSRPYTTAQSEPSETIESPPMASASVQPHTSTMDDPPNRKDSKAVENDNIPSPAGPPSKGKWKATMEEIVDTQAGPSQRRNSAAAAAATPVNAPTSPKTSIRSTPLSYQSYNTIPMGSDTYANVHLGSMDLSSLPSFPGYNTAKSPTPHPIHPQWMQSPGQPSFDLYGQPSFESYGQPSLSYYPSTPSPLGSGRNYNRKLNLTRRNQNQHSLPSSSERYQVNRAHHGSPKDVNYYVVAVDAKGTELFGLCRVVPYLVGSRGLLDILASMRPHVQHLTDDITLDDDGSHVIRPSRMSFMDKALLFLLWMLSRPEEELSEAITKFLTSLETEDGRLVVFKDMGRDRLPERTTITLFEFGSMAIDWEEDGNPCCIAADREDAVTPWIKVLPYIRKRKIPKKYIEKAEYEEWIMLPESELEERIRRFVCDGELERKRQVEEQREISSRITVKRGVLGNTFHFTLPNPTDPLEWGAKRFSHEYPFGKLVDYAEERHDNALLPEERAKDEAAAQQQQQIKTKPKGVKLFLHNVTPKKKWFSTWPCWVVCFIIISAVSVALYFATTQTNAGITTEHAG